MAQPRVLFTSRLLAAVGASCQARTLSVATAAWPTPLELWRGASDRVERAETLPACYYTSPLAAAAEREAVFASSWQAACPASAVATPGDFVCGALADTRYLIVRGQDGCLRAFHNVCRHHAAPVARGAGCGAQSFTCGYHGWTYDDRGRLIKATRLRGIQGFKAPSYGLHPIQVDVWGHLVFLRLRGGDGSSSNNDRLENSGSESGGGSAADTAAAAAEPKDVAQWLGSGGARCVDLGLADVGLVHLLSRSYELACDWKVVVDNYLDGGYHVQYAHPGLADGLDLSSYTNELHDVLSIQRCAVAARSQPGGPGDAAAAAAAAAAAGAPGTDVSDTPDRLGTGRDAAYAWVWPNLMINRYGPWMDTNVVVPAGGAAGGERCIVRFDYWLEAGTLAAAAATVDAAVGAEAAAEAAAAMASGRMPRLSPEALAAARSSTFVVDSLKASDIVQREDTELCEGVQMGLRDPVYRVGRYAPGPEALMYAFHQRYYAALQGAGAAPSAAAA